MDWLAKGGWKRWKDVKSQGHKDKCFKDINNHLQEEGFEPRSNDSIQSKIRQLEDRFKKALTWINSTGAGSYSLEPEEDGDGRSPYQREIDKRCKYYNVLVKAFGERGSMIPKRIYSSMEAKNNQEAENDVMCALGLKKWDFEEESDDADEEEEDEDHEDAGNNVTMETPTPGSKVKKPSHSTQSSSAGRSSRSTGIVKPEDVSSFLRGKGETEKRRLDIEEKKLSIERKKARLEGIATLVKAGVSLDDAKKTWDDDVSDGDE